MKRENIIRLIALSTAFIFSATSLSWAQVPAPGTGKATLSSATRLSLDRITIPEELGSIQTKVMAPGQNPSVILIQDAHAIVDAQMNIQGLIEYLQTQYGINLVALEGGKGTLDPTLFRSFPEGLVKKKVLGQYLERGELSGAEMAAVFNPKEAAYVGIEDWNLYEENYLAYLRAMQVKEKILKKLKVLKTQFDQKREKIYSPKLNEFHKHVEAFYEESSHLLELLKYLKGLLEAGKLGSREAGKKSPDFRPPSLLAPSSLTDSNYPHLAVLFESLARDSSMEKESLELQIRRMTEDFRKKYFRKLPLDKQKEFNRHTQTFFTGAIDSGSFLKTLVQIAHSIGIKPKLTSTLQALLGHVETLSTIKGTKLFDELQSFLEKIEASLIAKPEERNLTERYKKLRLLKDLANLELTREGWEELGSWEAGGLGAEGGQLGKKGESNDNRIWIREIEGVSRGNGFSREDLSDNKGIPERRAVWSGLSIKESSPFGGLKYRRGEGTSPHEDIHPVSLPGARFFVRSDRIGQDEQATDLSHGDHKRGIVDNHRQYLHQNKQPHQLHEVLASQLPDFPASLFLPAIEFYRLALARDQAFHRNLENLLKKEKAQSAIVLAGGFHAQGFEDSLKEAGYSYAVISPKINSLEGQKAYQEVMQGKLSYKPYLKTTFYDAFVRHSSINLVSELNEPDFKKNLKLWRDEVIRKLANEGRITEAGQYIRYIDLLFKTYFDKYGSQPRSSPASKQELLKAIEQELNSFRDETVNRLWQRFQAQFKEFTQGLRELIDTKALTNENVSSLLNRVGKPNSSVLVHAVTHLSMMPKGPQVPQTRHRFSVFTPYLGLPLPEESLETVASPVGPAVARIQPQLLAVPLSVINQAPTPDALDALEATVVSDLRNRFENGELALTPEGSVEAQGETLNWLRARYTDFTDQKLLQLMKRAVLEGKAKSSVELIPEGETNFGPMKVEFDRIAPKGTSDTNSFQQPSNPENFQRRSEVRTVGGKPTKMDEVKAAVKPLTIFESLALS